MLYCSILFWMRYNGSIEGLWYLLLSFWRIRWILGLRVRWPICFVDAFLIWVRCWYICLRLQELLLFSHQSFRNDFLFFDFFLANWLVNYNLWWAFGILLFLAAMKHFANLNVRYLLRVTNFFNLEPLLLLGISFISLHYFSVFEDYLVTLIVSLVAIPF